MIFIFGGAYQGKLDYAKEKFKVKTVCDCTEGMEPDFSCDAIYGIESFVQRCVKEGREAADYLREKGEMWQGEGLNKVFICKDVSQGLVPVDEELRAFREMNGRTMLYLAGEAEEVYRVFCGLGKREK